jgi:hypothetical protein
MASRILGFLSSGMSSFYQSGLLLKASIASGLLIIVARGANKEVRLALGRNIFSKLDEFLTFIEN